MTKDEAVRHLNAIVVAHRALSELTEQAKAMAAAVSAGKKALGRYIHGLTPMPLFDRFPREEPDDEEAPTPPESNGKADHAKEPSLFSQATEAAAQEPETEPWLGTYLKEFLSEPRIIIRLGAMRVQTAGELRDYLFASRLLWPTGPSVHFSSDELASLRAELETYEQSARAGALLAAQFDPPAAKPDDGKPKMKRPKKPRAKPKRPKRKGPKPPPEPAAKE